MFTTYQYEIRLGSVDVAEGMGSSVVLYFFCAVLIKLKCCKKRQTKHKSFVQNV